MMIPNEEVKYIYRNSIKEWFEEKLKDTNLEKLYNAVLKGDCDSFRARVNRYLAETISYYDYAEDFTMAFYAGF